MFIFCTNSPLTKRCHYKKGTIYSEDCLPGGFPTTLFHCSLGSALPQVLLRSPRHALHRRRPGRVHGPGRLLRSPCHALHRRRPGRVHGPARLLRSPCHALHRRHLRWILEGATIYDDSAGTSGDYAIVVSRDPGSDATAMTSGDYAIIPSHNPDNGVWAGNASRQKEEHSGRRRSRRRTTPTGASSPSAAATPQ